MKKCPTCGAKAHDFENEEALDCVPPPSTLKFGEYIIDEDYRKALFDRHPTFTTEEVLGSHLGNNPSFPSEEDWLEENDLNESYRI